MARNFGSISSKATCSPLRSMRISASCSFGLGRSNSLSAFLAVVLPGLLTVLGAPVHGDEIDTDPGDDPTLPEVVVGGEGGSEGTEGAGDPIVVGSPTDGME